MSETNLLFETAKQMEQQHLPNFFRLYLNPFVAQTVYCLNRLLQETFNRDGGGESEYQSFLANSFEEALSGAIKLARFAANLEGRARRGLVLDPTGRLENFAGVDLGDGSRLDFIPELDVLGPNTPISSAEYYGFVVFVPGVEGEPFPPVEGLDVLVRTQTPSQLVCVSRFNLGAAASLVRGWRTLPDMVIFDGSFIRGQVPFAAFTARRSLYDLWNKPKLATFHSTTFQPNTLVALQFMKCLEADAPDFVARHAAELRAIQNDAGACRQQLTRLYNPALVKTIATLGMDTLDATCSGPYVTVKGQRFFDGISGIACSVRGHNPPGYAEDLEALAGVEDYHAAAVARLKPLTGLDHLVPAVSGASAVENALRLGLVAQHPRTHVLALKGGFGGKTLFALTGTANATYKAKLDPLYADAIFVDPFAPNAIAELDRVLEQYPVGIVQMELIQGVGGVRAIPQEVVQFLAEERRRRGYLLLVDEVQTGMFRTGPFVRSQALGLRPDLLTLGKGASDMMFPFSATLYSAEVHEKLERARPGFADRLRRQHDLEFGYKTLINVLDRGQEMKLSEHVAEVGEQLRQQLAKGLADCAAVREVRGFGMLLAIELDLQRRPRRWLRKQAHSIYLLNMLRDSTFPVLVGFCQYEPHVLKLTPPLNTTAADAARVGDTIVRTLHRPFYRLLPTLCGALARSYLGRPSQRRHTQEAHA